MGYLLSPLYMIGSGTVGGLIFGLLSIASFVLTIWMIIDCIRNRRDMWWIWIMLIFWGVGALVYFLAYYFDASRAFRGMVRRHHLNQHIRELESKAYHIDNAYHRTKLADAYREQKRLEKAAENYKAALAHDPNVFEAKAHLGYVLVDIGKAEEAGPLLAEAVSENPGYEYGELLWYSARCAVMVDELDTAREFYEQLLQKYRYPRARVEYAELLEKLGERELAVQVLRQVVIDWRHVPRYQARAERKSLRRASSILRGYGIKV